VTSARVFNVRACCVTKKTLTKTEKKMSYLASFIFFVRDVLACVGLGVIVFSTETGQRAVRALFNRYLTGKFKKQDDKVPIDDQLLSLIGTLLQHELAPEGLRRPPRPRFATSKFPFEELQAELKKMTPKFASEALEEEQKTNPETFFVFSEKE